MTQVATTRFLKDIQEVIYEGNEFIKFATSHDAYVEDETVKVPQAGTIPAVEKNRVVLPAAVGQRVDTTLSYDLDEYTTDPMVIRNIEKIQLSYDKRKSVLKSHTDKLNERIGDQFLFDGSGSGLISATNGQIVLTTGTATAGITPPGGTGNRKAIALANFGSAAKKLDKDGFHQDNRYMVVPSDMYHSFIDDNTTVLSKEYNPVKDADIAMGVVRKVRGWNIILRPSTSVYADAGTPTLKAIGAAEATTDHWGCVGFHRDAIARAIGSIKFFANLNDAGMYGDYYSALIMFASKILRSDGKGIVTIVQDS